MRASPSRTVPLRLRSPRKARSPSRAAADGRGAHGYTFLDSDMRSAPARRPRRTRPSAPAAREANLEPFTVYQTATRSWRGCATPGVDFPDIHGPAPIHGPDDEDDLPRSYGRQAARPNPPACPGRALRRGPRSPSPRSAPTEYNGRIVTTSIRTRLHVPRPHPRPLCQPQPIWLPLPAGSTSRHPRTSLTLKGSRAARLVEQTNS